MKRPITLGVIVGLMAAITLANPITVASEYSQSSTTGGTNLEEAQNAQPVVGAGPIWAKAVCIGCGAAVLHGGGASVVGFLSLIVWTAPLIILCAGFCIVGYA